MITLGPTADEPAENSSIQVDNGLSKMQQPPQHLEIGQKISKNSSDGENPEVNVTPPMSQLRPMELSHKMRGINELHDQDNLDMNRGTTPKQVQAAKDDGSFVHRVIPGPNMSIMHTDSTKRQDISWPELQNMHKTISSPFEEATSIIPPRADNVPFASNSSYFNAAERNSTGHQVLTAPKQQPEIQPHMSEVHMQSSFNYSVEADNCINQIMLFLVHFRSLGKRGCDEAMQLQSQFMLERENASQLRSMIEMERHSKSLVQKELVDVRRNISSLTDRYNCRQFINLT